jgi:hypothetical protein
VDVARELVEHDDRGQCGARIAEEPVRRRCQRRLAGLREPRLDAFVELGIAGIPVLRVEFLEPELEHGVGIETMRCRVHGTSDLPVRRHAIKLQSVDVTNAGREAKIFSRLARLGTKVPQGHRERVFPC